ncbi:MAG: hypothetical protein DLM73_16645 [Chthoniobacterales bacterium]|nr:MAG: hypothetical protein DLM73_16645 [Chthoniobacterales bacterium]
MSLRLLVRFRFSLFFFFFLASSTHGFASAATPPLELSLDATSWQASWSAGALMLLLLFTAYCAMKRYEVPLALALTLVSLSFLIIQWGSAEGILRASFLQYANITVLFTAIAIPAHMIERSQGFKVIAAWLGYQLGKVRLRHPRITTPLLVIILLTATYLTSALMHTVPSILLMTPIIIRLCASYKVPSRWILSAAIIASNLGDTPNIVESDAWGIQASDFVREVLPANLIVLAALIFLATVLTQRGITSRSRAAGATQVPFYTLQVAQTAADWKKAKSDVAIDRRLLGAGLALLFLFLLFRVLYPPFAIAIGAATIVVAILLERKQERYHSLTSLGFDVYLAFAAIFVLAGCVEHSWIGLVLHQQLAAAHGAAWAIAATGYLGTTFTADSSLTTAVSHTIQQMDPSRAGIWALAGGICAGGSSLITASSAGIILAEESQRFNDPEHAINFQRYLAFGLPFSFFMLIFYGIYYTFVR